MSDLVDKVRAQLAEMEAWAKKENITITDPGIVPELADRIEKLEAQLAKAQDFVQFLDANYSHVFGDIARQKIRTLYAELKGKADE